MSFFKRLGLATMVVALVMTLPSLAHAKSIARGDALDAAARVDITRVTYTNREFTVSTRVKVENLRRMGTLRLKVAPRDTDIAYIASVAVRSDGTLKRHLRFSSLGRSYPSSCRVGAMWSAGKDVARISVPHSCLKFGRFHTRYYMKTWLRSGEARDHAAARTVGRGDTPGCATKTEVGRLKKGMAKAHVHARLDTTGRFGDGGGGGYSRIYRSCFGGEPWILEYRYDHKLMSVFQQGG